jgi:hypothetical protein
MVEQFKDALDGCNYYPRKADHCLFIKKASDDEPKSIVIIYVDDGGTTGTPEDTKGVI